jgi:hypothetical protein
MGPRRIGEAAAQRKTHGSPVPKPSELTLIPAGGLVWLALKGRIQTR